VAVSWVAVFISRAVIALMMEAACTSETPLNVYRTAQRNNPQDSHLRTRRCENLKSHLILGFGLYSHDYLMQLESGRSH
jgi:hypothetical protein